MVKNLLITATLLTLPVLFYGQTNPEYSWRYYRPGNTGIQGDIATALWIDANGNPYIAANTGNWGEGGFARFDVTSNTWINYSNVDYSDLGSFDNGDVQIHEIIEDYDQNLWMANFEGAMRFDPTQGIGSLVRFGPGNSALQGYTMDMDLAPDSSIWFVSGGLVRYKPDSDQWTYLEGANSRIAVQPKPGGGYIVWSADIYYGYVFTYDSYTGVQNTYLPSALGEVAGLPGRDCVDDAGNLWALRMAEDGDWETLEYQRPDGTWVYPDPPYQNVSFYIDAFKAYGDAKALLVTTTGETWMFDGTSWTNYGTWRPGEFTMSVGADQQGNVWICGLEGAARRDAATGNWQRYRITNTSQIDYFVEDFCLDDEGNVWMSGNAGTGVGGFQKFDGERWTGFNPYNYGLGYPFPYDADNTQAITRRPSNGDVIFNPTFHGIHGWDGTNYFPIEDLLTTSQALLEDSQGRLWSLEEYGGLRYYDEPEQQWVNLPLTGWGHLLRNDPQLPGTIWASTDYMIMRTDGNNTFSRTIEDFPGSAPTFTGLAVEPGGIAWIGTWLQFTPTGSTLIRLDANTGEYQTWSYDEGWPFPGEHVRPMTVTPDGLLWLQYDSEYPSDESGLCWYDGENVGYFQAPPGGVPQWGGLPNSSFLDVKVRELEDGYELWMSCLGRGIAVLTVITDPVGIGTPEATGTTKGITAFPNPAVEKVELIFHYPGNEPLDITIHDGLGRKVAVIRGSSSGEGRYTAVWDLAGHDGSQVIPGVYIARIQGARLIKPVKFIVL